MALNCMGHYGVLPRPLDYHEEYYNEGQEEERDEVLQGRGGRRRLRGTGGQKRAAGAVIRTASPPAMLPR